MAILRYGPVAAAVAAVAAAGVLHGRAVDRWGTSERLAEAVGALQKVPAKVDAWAGKDLDPIPEAVLNLAQINGYVQRAYTAPGGDEPMSVLLVCGRGGPISVHTPDICFAGAGFRQMTEAVPTTVEAGGLGHTLRAAKFAEPGGRSGVQEVLWAWSADGREWSSPDNPRRQFAREKALYKLYVVRKVPPAEKAGDPNPAHGFLRTALPAFAAALGS